MRLCPQCQKGFEGKRCPDCEFENSRQWNRLNRDLEIPLFGLLAGLVGLAIAINAFMLLDKLRIFAIGLALFLAPLLLIGVSNLRRRIERDGKLLRTISNCCGVALPAFAILVVLNGALDHAGTMRTPTRIMRKQTARGRSVSYQLIVQSWRPGRMEETLDVNYQTFGAAHTGETIDVDLHPGLLGLAWYGAVSLR